VVEIHLLPQTLLKQLIMKITINNQELETNPTGINTNLVFMGTVHDGTERQVDVYGFNAEQVIEVARKIKSMDSNYNTVHIYGPSNIGSNRTHVGTKFLD
jgi:hypothetical protein